MRTRSTFPLRCLHLAPGLMVLAACSRDPMGIPQRAAVPAAGGSPHAVRAPRNHSPELDQLRRDLDHGRLEAARAGLALAKSAGGEAPLLEARAAALAGRRIEALRLIEIARAKFPRDPEVYATAAEIYAARGSFDSAWAEIRRGEDCSGTAPELLRARGCVWIAREGGAEKGLRLLEEAQRADPSLAFLERPLAQAHLLLAKAAAAAHDPARTLDHVHVALTYDPSDVDTRRLLAETCASVGDYQGSIAVLEELIAEGEPLGSELALTCKRAGIAALLARERTRALAFFAAARQHGLTDAELATGARLLAEEARARVAAGVEAYTAGDVEAAEQRFREALFYDPLAIDAQNHLAVVCFQKHDLPGAIELWRSVLAAARAEKLALPEPVHMNLAKAQYQVGDAEGARVTLEEYLDRDPNGEWVENTREMLALLERPTPH